MGSKEADKIENIEAFLNRNKISGIIRIPNKGTFAIFQTFGDRMVVLDQARLELMIRDAELQDEAKQRGEYGQRKGMVPSNRPGYVG